MAAKTIRRVIKIDEVKCNGCGACVPACAEGALKIIDGKARLASETYCDGLGACLGKCPQGAIIIEEREALDFDGEAAEQHFHEETGHAESLPCGCPGTAITEIERSGTGETPTVREKRDSRLSNFPFQMALVPPTAPFLKGADLLLAADCVPFACAGFHEDFLEGHVLLIACPKLDDFEAHQKKLAAILRQAKPRSLTVVHMEVPCCSGLTYMAEQAVRLSGCNVPVRDVTIGVLGEVKQEA
jgi:ferredoxin